MTWLQTINDEWRELHTAVFGPVQTIGAPDEGALIQSAAEGQAARQFLESETVRRFMSRAEANIVARMVELPLSDNEGRRNFAVAVQTLRQLRVYLAQAAQQGGQAERELERMRSGKRDFF